MSTYDHGRDESVEEILREKVERLTNINTRLKHELDLEASDHAKSQTEIERLQAIVAKLPKTADSVAIVPGMTVYFVVPPYKTVGQRPVCMAGFPFETCVAGYVQKHDYATCYSTRNAAEAAEGGERCLFAQTTKDMVAVIPLTGNKANCELCQKLSKLERQREVLRECRRFIDTAPVSSDLWASGLCRELDEVLKGPLPAADAKGGES